MSSPRKLLRVLPKARGLEKPGIMGLLELALERNTQVGFLKEDRVCYQRKTCGRNDGPAFGEVLKVRAALSAVGEVAVLPHPVVAINDKGMRRRPHDGLELRVLLRQVDEDVAPLPWLERPDFPLDDGGDKADTRRASPACRKRLDDVECGSLGAQDGGRAGQQRRKRGLSPLADRCGAARSGCPC